MSHSKPLELPQELVDKVIDNLSKDLASLKAASLVGRPWCNRTRPHLFRRVVLSFRPDALARWSKIQESLELRPTLGGYVKDLMIIRRSGQEQWPNTHTRSIVRVLSFLQSVASFAFQRRGPPDNGRFQWGEVPRAEAQNAFYDLFALPSLEIIRLSDIANFDVASLLRCRSIKVVTLERVDPVEHADSEDSNSVSDTSDTAVRHPDTSIVTTRARPIRLHASSLSGLAIGALLKQSVRDAPIFRLTCINLNLGSLGDAMMEHWPAFLTACSGTLEEYRLTLYGWGPTGMEMEISELFNIPVLPKLRVLALSTLYRLSSEWGSVEESPLQPLVDRLKELAKHGDEMALTELDIEVGMDTEPPYHDQDIYETLDILDELSSDTVWTELNEALIRPKLAFPHLESVTISLFSRCNLGGSDGSESSDSEEDLDEDWGEDCRSRWDDAKASLVSDMQGLVDADLLDIQLLEKELFLL